MKSGRKLEMEQRSATYKNKKMKQQFRENIKIVKKFDITHIRTVLMV